MNGDIIKANWKQIRGKIREKWGELTDDDLDRIEGQRDQLLGAVEKKYGLARDEAERQVRSFETALPR
ncbi:MAG: CsbD family protein [Pirellulales bacterium]